MLQVSSGFFLGSLLPTGEGVTYEWDHGKLSCIQAEVGTGVRQGTRRQLVVAQKYRRYVLQKMYDIPLAGHLGHQRTLHCLTQNFFWPGL